MAELYSDLGGLNSNLMGFFDGSSYNNIDAAVRACVDSLPNGNNITYFRTVLKDSLYKAIIQKYVNSDFAFAVVFSYVSKTIQCYRKIGGRWENTESLITKSDLVNPYANVLLPWGNYADGTYTLSESITGKATSVAVGNYGRLRADGWTPPSINDVRSIVIPGGGVIDIKILSATQVQITGTTPDYRVRDILAI